MSLPPQTATEPALPPPPPPGVPLARPAFPEAPASGRGDRRLRYGGLALVIAISAVLNTVRLSQNGYANIFYSAGVRSMLGSLHNFLFASFDQAGLVSVDKPPLALWVQVVSAKLFGFSTVSVLLPEALIGVAAVAALYLALERRFGLAAGIAGGIAFAVFPSFVAVSRANGVDPLLILLMTLAAWSAVRACETGGWVSLLGSAALVGLAFNTKTLAAYLVVPAIALGYLVCSPVPIVRRLLALLAAGLVLAAVSFAWIAMVEATAASKRPYVGSSTHNTELGLTFEYNGFGRVGGQRGGPGQIYAKSGAAVPKHVQQRVDRHWIATHPHVNPVKQEIFPRVPRHGHAAKPIPFGASPGPFRLFGKGLGDQGGWYLPLALFGLLAVGLMLFMQRRLKPPERPATPGGRRDPRLAFTIVFGGWFLTEAFVLSSSKGIVHPYYTSALAPGTAAMVGAGAVAIAWLARRRSFLAGLALAGCAVVATIGAEVVQMHREHFLVSLEPLLLLGGALCLLAILIAGLSRRPAIAAWGVGIAVALLLVIPADYARSTWLAPVEATFPAAGPTAAKGDGGVGLDARGIALYRALIGYLHTHGAAHRFELLTVASDTAAPFILMGTRAAAMGGYSGDDPALDGPTLARLVEHHEARYALLGGVYSTRGGNKATNAVLHVCTEIPPFEWNSPVAYPSGLVLFDCAGHEAALAAFDPRHEAPSHAY